MPPRETPPTDDHTVLGRQVAAIPPAAALRLLELQAATLFAHDERGRLTGTNETPPDPAPRLFLAQSTGGALWRLHADVPDDLATRLADLLTALPPIDNPTLPPPVPVEILATLAAHAPITEVYAGPSWLVPEDTPPPARARLLTADDAPTLYPEFAYTAEHLDLLAPNAAVIEDGRTVALCSAVRTTLDACEAGLYTLEAARGRGLGPDAVLAWAAAVRATGRLPLYSTAWHNAASRRVAAKLSLHPYGTTLSIY